MHQKTHVIPIVAGFEIIPSPDYQPTLDKSAAEAMAHALAADLARQLPPDLETLLVVGGLVVEPNQLLRPHFGTWLALDQLAKPVIRDQGLHSGVLAIGAHQGQLPDERLQPTQYTLMGQFVCIPMLLVVDADQGSAVEAKLEASLFESGSINPPARALLAQHAKLESIHGQLLTRNDLLALQRVQLDSAGLGGFWDVIEAVLLSPDQDQSIPLPAKLQAHWQANAGYLQIEFLTFSQWVKRDGQQASDWALGYGRWLRAYRTTQALVENHGIDWQVKLTHPATLDDRRACVIESSALNHTDRSSLAGLTEHMDPGLGLVAWTLIEDDRMIHLYPIQAQAIGALQRDFFERGIHDTIRVESLCYNDSLEQLSAALRP